MTARTAIACVAAAVALAYATAFPGAFQYDDWNIVVGNGDVHGLAAWLASMPGIRPLTKATYALNWTIGAQPAAFVAFNVACHAASALLVLSLVRRWLPGLSPATSGSWFAAGVAALVFALHPAQTEAVAYIAGRSVSLAACLYLASLYAWERARANAKDGAWSAMSLAAFGAALAARETAWTLPFALLLVEAARGTPVREALWRLRWHGVMLALALAMFGASATYRRLLGTSLALRDPLENLAAQVDAITYLMTHPLLTLRLSIDPEVASTSGATWLVRLAVIAALLVVGLVQLRVRPWLGVALLWFFLHLFPTNGLIARLDPANDRQLYLALVGPALAAGVMLERARPRPAARAIALVVVAGLGMATLLRNADYRSEVALWEATARASPRKARVWNNLGHAHMLRGDRDLARVAFERAVAIDPAHYKAVQNLHDLQSR